jgi:Ca2+-binding RTX toxin-like protein
MQSPITQWYEAVVHQMAAEAYFENVDLIDPRQVGDALRRGNNRLGFPDDRGLTRFTTLQADEFMAAYRVVAQASDYPDPNRTSPVYYAGTNILANTGMAATLIQTRGTGEFTLAIRSTEFERVSRGGDRDRDGYGADLNGIFLDGFALAQLAALEDYYAWLKQSGNLPAGAILNVTGYSLGGHLATVFTEIHAADTDIAFGQTTTFNGAGRGQWTGADNPGEMVAYYKAVLADPTVAAGWGSQPGMSPAERELYDKARNAASLGVPLDPLSIYSDPRHAWAQYAARMQYQLWFNPLDAGSADLRNGAAERITQIYGREYSPEWTGVANSGVHGPATGVFVEAQPLLEPSLAEFGGATDYGNGHSLVLLADSLALMRAFQTLDATLSLDSLNRYFAAFSNKVADTNLPPKSEDDPLENALDALRRLFLGMDAPATPYKPGARGFGSFDFRNRFHDHLVELTTSAAFQNWAGEVQLADLTEMSAAELLAAAQGDIAWRYAVKDLNPFAVTGAQALHESHNLHGDLDLHDPASASRAGMTQLYLAERAEFLAWKNIANRDNVDRLKGPSGPANWRYIDVQSSYAINVVGQVLGHDSTEPFHVAAFGNDRNDAVIGGPVEDHLYGGAGGDYLQGKLGNDYLEGGRGRDLYQYDGWTNVTFQGINDGADTIFDTDGRGILRYTYSPLLGSDVTTFIIDTSVKLSDTRWTSADGRFTYRLISGSEGRQDLLVEISGDAGGSMTLKDFRDGDFGIRLAQPRAIPGGTAEYGTENGDTLNGTSGTDILYALGGDDSIRAGAGDDFASGGPGMDIVEGEAGDDILAGDDGNDVVAGGDGDDVVFAGSVVTLPGALLAGETEAPTGLKGEWVDGGEGSDTVVGGRGNDQVMGGGGADLLIGGAGDDNLVGDTGRVLVHVSNWAVRREVATSGGVTTYRLVYNGDALVAESAAGGADTLYGGAGDDWIFAGAGDDFADGGSGADVIFGEAGDDILVGGAGDDVLVGDNPGVVAPGDEGDDILDGGDGADLLYGNGGDDILIGGRGNDTLVGGPGRDLYVFVKGDGIDTIVDELEGTSELRNGVLLLGEGYSRSSIIFRPGSLMVDLGDGDAVHIEGMSQLDPASTPVLGEIRFADGSSMSYAEILEQGFDVDGTDGDDDGHDGAHPQLAGTGVADRIRGHGGNDHLFGFGGNDSLSGGDGDDALVGGDGDDTLDGGAGTDTLWGGAGDDRYRFARGGGTDLVVDQDATAGNLDAIEVAPDLAPDDVIAERGTLYGSDLVLTVYGSDDSVTIADQFGATGEYAVEEIRFADGTVWTPATTPLWRRGTAASEVLLGTSGPDVLEGRGGNDMLAGGSGNDIYRFNRGDGQDFVRDDDSAPGNVDTVLFGPGILPAEVRATRSGTDLDLGIIGSSDRVRVSDYFLEDGASPYALERIRFLADGTVWDYGAVLALLGAPTAGNDTLYGSGGSDLLQGLAGDDELHGGGGDDTLDGGPGADLLYGEGGSDTYLFERGGGADTVVNATLDASGTTDVLQFASSIAPADVAVTRSGNDLLLAVTGTADSVRLRDYFLGEAAVVEQICFADGTVWTEHSIAARFPVSGTSGNDLLQGSGLSESISGFAGNDTIHGGAGNDTLDGGLGVDYLYGGPGNDLLIAGAGEPKKNGALSNFLYGGAGDDVLVSSGRRDYLYGEAGNDIYLGGADVDWMEDTGGNNLWLGDGNDIAMKFYSVDGDRDVDGVRGRDVLLVNKSESGSATRLGTGSTLSLGGGILYKDLALWGENNLLKLTYGNKVVGFGDWYGDAYTPPNRAIAYLQIVIEGTRDYNASSANPMSNRKIQVFDFLGLVADYDAARAAGKTFNVAANLPNHWLWSSDSEAFGGAVAYQYARTGNLGTLTHDQMRAVIGDPAFAVGAQPIAPAVAALATESTTAAESTVVSDGEPMLRAAYSADVAAAVGTQADEPMPFAAGARPDSARRIAGGIRPGDLPHAWFVQPPTDEPTRSVSSAWRHIARALPAHLASADVGDVGVRVVGVRVHGVGVDGVGVSFGGGIGLSDASAARLRPFEGLKEGFAPIA